MIWPLMLIRLGYQLVGMKKYQEAIAIFRLSVGFPRQAVLRRARR